jgi:hypothetical protein
MLGRHQKNTKYCLKIQESKAKEELEKSSELNCKFCGKQFKTKYLLNKHQTQAKYCLKIQESQNSESIIKSFVTCTFCNKNFSSSTFNRHDSTCKKKNQFLLNQKDQEIAMMKMKAENAEEIAILKMKAEIGSIYKESAERAQATIEEIAIIKAWQTVVEIEQETETPEELIDEPYELVPLELDNGYIIESRDEDGYIDVTNLCTAGKKKFNDWNRLNKTNEFLKELSSSAGIPAVELIKQNSGGNGERHTWVHPQVAINIAQWISPQFDVKVSAWVLEVMMTGKVDITNTKSYRELQQDNKQFSD